MFRGIPIYFPLSLRKRETQEGDKRGRGKGKKGGKEKGQFKTNHFMARKSAVFGSGGDRAVMETSDDAAVSKHSAVEKGYYRVRNGTAPVYCARPVSSACTPLTACKVLVEHAMTRPPSATDRAGRLHQILREQAVQPPAPHQSRALLTRRVRPVCRHHACLRRCWEVSIACFLHTHLTYYSS